MYKVTRLSLEKNVFFRGSINKVEKYLWKNNFYIHTAFKEAFGLVLIEAMASNTAVISFNGKGNKDIVINNKTGFLIEELNYKNFGDTIINLFENKKEYFALTGSAYNFSKGFDINKYVIKLNKLYNAVRRS